MFGIFAPRDDLMDLLLSQAGNNVTMVKKAFEDACAESADAKELPFECVVRHLRRRLEDQAYNKQC